MLPILLAAVAAATPLPKEVALEARGFVTQPGAEQLYEYRNDTMVGMSHCFAACAVAWPPLLASPQAQPSADWTLVPREDGVKQWAYKDRPLYSASIPHVRVEKAVADGLWRPAKPR